VTSPSVDKAREALEPVIAAVRAGDMASAKRLASEALDRGAEHPMLLNLRALAYEDAGLLKNALADLQRAHALAPGDFAILNACGLVLTRMERFDEALGRFDQCLAIKPDFAPAWLNRGHACERSSRRSEAASAYERAVALDPNNVLALASAAFLAASRGDRTTARKHAEAALRLQPDFPTAVFALAMIGGDEPQLTERRLRTLLASELSLYDRALALGLLADALDAQDRPSEAFGAYEASNAALRSHAAPRFETAGQPTISATVLWLNGWAQRLDVSRWQFVTQAIPGPLGERGHVFLLGFPRSGTTLAESALGAHPDIVTLEERNTLQDSVRTYLTDPKDVAGLAEADADSIEPLRAAYWRRVAEYGAKVQGKVFIDKLPFNTLSLPVILKLFPAAKILFAVRDPRDVVLSCFRRRFDINSLTYEFLDLSRAASAYDGTMRLAERLREKVAFHEHRLTYERLVADFEGEMKSVCDFIGVDWRPDLANFAERAKRGEVASASAAQIARGLYADGSGHWRKYSEQLKPVLPILEPWVSRFGYRAD
jgi:tetratricopeptide (TPR) repeat protein